MTEETRQKLKEVKQSFRLIMDGVAAASMRDKGLNYHLNWGAKITDLQNMAKELGKDYPLAIELWKENVRECRLLALMIMPPEKMLPEIAELWAETLQTVEMAEMAPFFLFQYLDYAPSLAFKWLASDDKLRQVCGFMILARLFTAGTLPDTRGVNEVVDQAVVALHDESLPVRKAAMACLNKLADAGALYQQAVDSALKKAGF